MVMFLVEFSCFPPTIWILNVACQSIGPIHGRSMTPMGTPGSTPLQAMERPGELIDIRNIWMIFFVKFN